MEGKNAWSGIGNLCDDGRLGRTKSGEAVYSFRIACTESYFDKQSKERKERTEFVNNVLWGARGEALSKILRKGSRVHIDGRLQTRSYEKDGQKHWSTEINVQNVILLDVKRGSQDGDSTNGGGGYEDHGQAGGEFDDSSIPF